MRSKSLAIGLLLTFAIGSAQAADWRATAFYGREVAFVEVDSVVRRNDGSIGFRATLRLSDSPTYGDFPYDRIDVAVSGRCGDGSPRSPSIHFTHKYLLRGAASPGEAWRSEELVEDVEDISSALCRGLIGQRRFSDPSAAMIGFSDHSSVAMMISYRSQEMEMVGLVTQGFEASHVTLCGSGTGCSPEAPLETCWLEGPISVPTPADAPEWQEGSPRRDTAAVAFRGRISRSPTGDGFGHMGAAGCLVEVTGPYRFITTPWPSPTLIDYGAPGRSPGALAAHAALRAEIAGGGPLEISEGNRRWPIDELALATLGGSDACISFPRNAGKDLDFAAPAFGWNDVLKIEQTGSAVTYVSTKYDEDLAFHLATPAAAAAMGRFAADVLAHSAKTVSQKGHIVTLGFGNGKRRAVRFPDSASAIEAAGIGASLLHREIARVNLDGNTLYALIVRRIALSFPNAARAQAAALRMRALAAACEMDLGRTVAWEGARS